MNAVERSVVALRFLATMPLLDRLELAAVSGMYEEASHKALDFLRREGLADCLRHASPITSSTRRWYLTADGLDRLALEENAGVDRLLRTRPVSAHWQRLLLARLDPVAVIYRLASALASVEGSFQFRWYRASPLDAAVGLPGGRSFGIIRQGATTDRTALAERVNWLVSSREALPRGLLALLPDETRLYQARRLLARYPGPVYLALERDAARYLAEDAAWRIPSNDSVLTLNEVMGYLRPGGGLPHEPPRSKASLPGSIVLPGADGDVANHLLPVLLKPADKRMLDCLSDWPWATVEDLCGILDLSDSRVWRRAAWLGDLGLVSTGALKGKRRLALSRRGLAFLARRDRTSVSAAFRRWSAEPVDQRPLSCWRDVPGGRSRPLARTMEHTQAVHRFMGALIRQEKWTPGCRVLQVSPPHHSTRYFPHRGRLRSVHPDGFGVVRAGGKTLPFFLEWERRAMNPSTMAARLAPYLRYYSSNRPLDDHGHRPLVLVVFDDYLAEGNFLGVARSEMERARVNVPLWVSYRELLERVGPLGKAWRNPEVLEPSSAFR